MVRSKSFVLFFAILCAFILISPAFSEDEAKRAETDNKSAENAPKDTPKEESSVTDHSLKIGVETIPYKATAGTILLKNEKDEPTALVYSTSYTRSDIKDLSHRPLAFVYNGGPGSSSILLHMGAFGPRRVDTVDVGNSTIAPFALVDNAESLIDVCDLVFVDPVGTGFSRAVGKSQDKDFWGIDQDVESLAQFIQTYISRNNRWNSPKFLIGESYGTFRSAALSAYLQAHKGVYLNGMVLISCVLDLGTISFNPGDDMPYVYYLPTYAATAWNHNMLKNRSESLEAFLNDARRFALNEYSPALMKGSRLTAEEKSEMAKKLSNYTGLSEDYLIKADLRVNELQFSQELQRSRGLVIARLDSRFSGPAYNLLSEYSEYDPQDVAITGPFVSTFNTYVREELKFGQQKSYRPLAEAFRDWDWKRKNPRDFGFPGAPNVLIDLVESMLTNQQMQVEVENGVYDLATPFFGTELTFDHLGLPEKLKSNIHQKYYEAGHMMYVRTEDRIKLKNNVADFIRSASKSGK